MPWSSHIGSLGHALESGVALSLVSVSKVDVTQNSFLSWTSVLCLLDVYWACLLESGEELNIRIAFCTRHLNPGTCALLNRADGFHVLLLIAVAILFIVSGA
jgi:hypothetical protein